MPISYLPCPNARPDGTLADMKVCVYGAGAIGGFIGARLGAAGCAVSAVARGATLKALQSHGVRLRMAQTWVTAPGRAREDATQLGPQDLVVIAVKAPALAAVAEGIAPLLRADDDPLVDRFCLAVMAEAAAIGARIGCPITQSGEERNAVTRRLGAFRTSMLQDVDAGKPVELDALVTVVREIGERVGVPTPHIDTLLGLARLHARVRGLYLDSGAGV